MGNQPAVDLSLLLAHERWAGRLARALVHDDDIAEDIVQEARVSFWRSAPTQSASVRAWLRAVIRNLAHDQGRVQARKRRDAEAVAAETTSPSAEELAQRLEGHQLLATLVGQLREPFRETIILRYYEGMSGAAIARRLAIPAGTVRWRIKTALDDLRAQLDERWKGGRQAWLALFAGWQPPRAAAPVGRAAGLASAGLVASVALLVGFTRIACDRSAPPSQAGEEATEPSVAAAQRAPRSAAPAPRLQAVAPDPGEEKAEVPAWALTSAFPRRIVAGRVVSGGRPLAGAHLRLSPGMLTHARELDRHTSSGSDGRFAFPPQAPTNWFLTVSAPDLVPQVLYVDLRAVAPRVPPRREAPEALTIDLEPCQLFARGQVRDAGGGAIAGARVKLTAMWNNGGTQVSTNDQGRYEICVPGQSREFTLVAEADGYGSVETLAYFQQSRAVDFTLEPAAVVSGQVKLPDDPARTLPAVKVTLGPVAPDNPNNPPIVGTQPVRLETVTDERGQFQLGELSAGRYRVQAVGDNLAATEVDQQIDLEAGERVRGLQVLLHATALVEGTVRRGGSPVPDVNLAFQIRGTPAVPEGHSVLYPWARSGPDGRYQVRLKCGAVVERILGPWPRKVAPAGFAVTEARMSAVDIDLPQLGGP
jgi:RNA polymerase sigma factor (sigma-70 family)